MRTLFLLLLISLTACSSIPTLKPFASDGCSLFPDGHLSKRDLWCDCCVVHDIAYWQGGTEQQKEEADLTFRQCVLDKTDDKRLADFMYQGVKYGGEPFFLNWYRWGYGWDYGRGYQVLSDAERVMVEDELDRIGVGALRCPMF